MIMRQKVDKIIIPNAMLEGIVPKDGKEEKE